MNKLRKLPILGIGVTVNPKSEILEYIKKFVVSSLWLEVKNQHKQKPPASNHQLIIVTPNPEQVVYAHSHPEFAKLLNQADIVVPDGAGIAFAARLLKSKNSELNDQQGKILTRIAGVELMEDLVKLAVENGYGIGLIGGKGDLAYRTFDILKSKYPDRTERDSSRAYLNTASLRMEGIPLPAMGGVRNDGFSPYVRGFALSSFNVSEDGGEDDSQKILRYFDEKGKEQRLVGAQTSELIYRYMKVFPRPLIVFVGLGAPKQEFFISNLSHLSNLSNLGEKDDKQMQPQNLGLVWMTVGGAFEMISGRIKRAPVWVRVLNLEWLWRLVIEPWRWRRQLALLKFILLLWGNRENKGDKGN